MLENSHVAEPLLAKSAFVDGLVPEHATLPGHTRMVINAALTLVRQTADWIEGITRGQIRNTRRLLDVVGAAALMHDLGKSSNHFQQLVRGKRDLPQLVRHEALSFVIVHRSPLWSWIIQHLGERDAWIALLAAAGHHRKFGSLERGMGHLAAAGSGGGSSITCFCSHADFAATLSLGQELLGWDAAPNLPDLTFKRGDMDGHLLDERDDAEDALDSDARRFLSHVKSLLIAADVTGSAYTLDGPAFITESLGSSMDPLRIATVLERRLRGHRLRAFQERIADQVGSLVLAVAGCGSGKTTGAYARWQRQYSSHRIWFCYPTTGTATEGFKDYLQASDLDADLIHSRAWVDLQFAATGRDEDDTQRAQDRQVALHAWNSEGVACTVDTVLGLVQNQRQGHYALPALLQSFLVFDEVHAYDDRLFGSLLRFLEAFPGLPVLLMTASLPQHRLEAINTLSLRIHGCELPVVPGPEDLESIPRYRKGTGEDAYKEVATCLDSGGKVLWVCNTVNRCIEEANRLKDRGVPNPFIYHSRFRYIDRIERHTELVQAFSAAGSMLACTTQVAEMSLDLSADLLVMDLAPIPAMIQRLGRLNRASPATTPARLFIVLPFEGAPYTAEELEEARRWLDLLPSRPVSQRELVQAWEQVRRAQCASVRESSYWLDEAFWTVPRPLREASPGVNVLLPSDLRACQSKPADVQKFVLPMNVPPRGLDWQESTFKHIPVVRESAITYDPNRGAQWQKQR